MLLRELNSRYDVKETRISLPISNSKQLAGVNAARWAIMFAVSSGGAGPFKISTQSVLLTQGTPIPAVGVPLIYTARDFPGMVAGNFYAISITAAIDVTVTEIFEIASMNSSGG